MSFLSERLHFYGENTNLHGLRYVADKKSNVFKRILWLVIFILSSTGMIRIFKGSYEAYLYNAISFVTETTYLDWNTSFPAITVCEGATAVGDWKSESNESTPAVQEFLSDIIFFTGSCYSCNPSCKVCASLNYHEMVKRFRKKCPQLMKQCRWNDITFNCCDKFLPLQTEYGVCFSINSLHTKKTLNSSMDLISNRKEGPGELTMEFADDVRVYIHSREDVPFINSDPDLRKDVLLGEIYDIVINIIEIANDENVKNIPVEKRGCRFPDEKDENLRVHEYYSYATCIVQCHAEAHIRLCNCTHHLMPVLGATDYCDINGLVCLSDNFETVNRLHAKGFDKPGLVCECVPSCVEPEYKIVSERKGMKANSSEVSIRLQSLPTFRFKRNVVRTTMDLVVSIGGTAGLFIGASLLSIVETIYLLFLRRP